MNGVSTEPIGDLIMVVKRYLKIEGIDGSSKDPGHAGEINILSYQLGSRVLANGSGSATARSGTSTFSFTKEFDSCSPELFRANVSGNAIPRIVLTEERFKRGICSIVKIEVLELKDAQVTSILPAPRRSHASGPAETIVLSAGSLQFK